MSSEPHVGPLRGFEDPEISEEERTLLRSFSQQHHLPIGELRVASIFGEDGAREAMVVVVSIDVLRRLARETGKLTGTDPPVFERDQSGVPAAATVRVRRSDLPRGLCRTAFWHERSPRVELGEPLGRWASDPDAALAEVAEALALRGAFPGPLEGVYTVGDLPDALRDRALGRVHAEHQLRQQLDALR